MTCIVALTHKKTVWMGADSCGSNGYFSTAVKTPKVAIIGAKKDYILGFTSSWRMGQLLTVGWVPPTNNSSDLDSFMVDEFISAVRKRLADGAWLKTKEGQADGGAFLVGHQGRLWSVDSDFQVIETASGFAACGSGQMAALGSLHTTDSLMAGNPKSRAVIALKAAADLTCGVRPPFVVKSLKSSV